MFFHICVHLHILLPVLRLLFSQLLLVKYHLFFKAHRSISSSWNPSSDIPTLHTFFVSLLYLEQMYYIPYHNELYDLFIYLSLFPNSEFQESAIQERLWISRSYVFLLLCVGILQLFTNAE